MPCYLSFIADEFNREANAAEDAYKALTRDLCHWLKIRHNNPHARLTIAAIIADLRAFTL